MRSLRRLDEERWKPKLLPWKERRRILEAIAGVLKAREEIALAVAHGGFIESQVFRDIDIAVFTGYRVSLEEEPLYTLRLSETLSRVANGIPVDVKLLDYAPPAFRLRALEKGLVLVERRPGLRTRLLILAREDLQRLNRIIPLEKKQIYLEIYAVPYKKWESRCPGSLWCED